MLFTDHIHGSDYSFTLYPLTCPTDKSHTASDLANEVATAPCLLFCHQKHLINEAQNYLLMHLV